MTSARVPGFETTKDPKEWPRERERLLANKITDLGLKIEGTYLQQLVERLYSELGRAGIQFKPFVYLSDEWSCPDRVPVIGVPLIEVNPNPYLEERSEVALAARKQGIEFADLIERIVYSALKRTVLRSATV